MTFVLCHMTSVSADILLTMYRVVYQELGIQSSTLWPENSGWSHVYGMISLIVTGWSGLVF